MKAECDCAPWTPFCWWVSVFRSDRSMCCARDWFGLLGSTRGTDPSRCLWTAFSCLESLERGTCAGCFAAPSPWARLGRATRSPGLVCSLDTSCFTPDPAPSSSSPRVQPAPCLLLPYGAYPVLFLKVYCIKAVKGMLTFYEFQILIGILHNICAAFLQICLYCKFLLFLLFLSAIWIQSVRGNWGDSFTYCFFLFTVNSNTLLIVIITRDTQ